MATRTDDALCSLSWLVGLNSATDFSALQDNAQGRSCWKQRPAAANQRAAPYSRPASLPQYWSMGGDDHTEAGDELPAERPSLSFTCLIGLAILRSKNQKAPVGSIYQFIHTNFPYFREAKPTWRNSIRHVLSLGKFFFKLRCTAPGGAGAGKTSKPQKAGNMWCIKAGAHETLLKLIEQGQKELSPAFAKHLSLHDLRSIRLKAHAQPQQHTQHTKRKHAHHHAKLVCKPELGRAMAAVGMVPLPPVHPHNFAHGMRTTRSAWASDTASAAAAAEAEVGAPRARDDMLLSLACMPDFGAPEDDDAPRVPMCVHDLDLDLDASLLDLGCHAHQVDQGCSHDSTQLQGLGLNGYDQGYDSSPHDSDCEVMSLSSSSGSTYSDCSDYSTDVCDMSFCDQMQWPAVPSADDATVPSWGF